MELMSATPVVLRRVARVSAFVVCLIGLAVLGGWAFEVPALRSIRPDWPNVAPATAAGFVLAAVSLWLVAGRAKTTSSDPLGAWIVQVCAAATSLIGLLKLAHYVFGLAIDLDTLGFTGPAYVSPATALDFLLIGGSLSLAGSRRRFGIFHAVTLASILVGVLGLASHLYGGELLLPYAQMAVHTSLSLVVLSIGILCTRADGGLMALMMSRTAGGWMVRRMLLVVPPASIAIGWLEERAEASRWFGDADPDPLFAVLNVIVLVVLISTAGAWLRRVDRQRAREAAMRRQHEAQLSLFVEYAPAAIAMLDRDLRYAAASRRWLTDYGLTTQNIIGRSYYEVFPETSEKWKAIHHRCLAGVVEKRDRDAFPRADGSIDWMHWEVHPWYEKSGGVGGLMLFSEVITERVRTAEKIRRLNRVYAILSQINSLIVRERDRQALLDEACRIVVDVGRFAFAWIGLLDLACRAILPVASAGHTAVDPPLTAIDISEGSPEAQSIPALAILGLRAVVDNNVATGAGLQDERYRNIVRAGYYSVVALPLVVDGNPAGVISMWSREADYFDSEEVQLLTELAGDIAFALEFLAKQEKLNYISYFDVLTGLANRTLFLDRLSQQLRAREPKAAMLAVLVLDIERFGMVNNTLGRSGADQLLRLVARCLEHVFGGKDNLARLGADVFAVVLPGIRDTVDILHTIEDRLLPALREPFIAADTELRISARIGVAKFPVDGDSADVLLGNSEAALKRAKSGRRSYQFYAADMNVQAAQVLSLETRLRHAVEAQEFLLHYQPKVKLGNRVLCGLEALLRWQDPQTGLVPPAKFIPVLEQTGLIAEVGRWAVKSALSDYAVWTARGYRVPRIAVNLSAVELRDEHFAAGIVDILATSGVGAHALGLEITESLIMEDIDRSIRALSNLRDKGIQIAIDDFGTGYSSLSYLARLPIDKLKIDRSFISGMFGNVQDKIVVSTIIALAHSFGLPVVAEGVETHEQAEALDQLGCDEAQGFYFCRPLAAHAVGDLLDSTTFRTLPD